MPIQVTGRVDENHILTAKVPPSVAAGEVKVVLIPQTNDEDEAGEAWERGVAEQWADELSDPRQDIYTTADGEPVDAPR